MIPPGGRRFGPVATVDRRLVGKRGRVAARSWGGRAAAGRRPGLWGTSRRAKHGTRPLPHHGPNVSICAGVCPAGDPESAERSDWLESGRRREGDGAGAEEIGTAAVPVRHDGAAGRGRVGWSGARRAGTLASAATPLPSGRRPASSSQPIAGDEAPASPRGLAAFAAPILRSVRHNGRGLARLASLGLEGRAAGRPGGNPPGRRRSRSADRREGGGSSAPTRRTGRSATRRVSRTPGRAGNRSPRSPRRRGRRPPRPRSSPPRA